MNHRKKYSQRLTVIGKRSLASLIALCMLFSFAPAVFSEGIELTEEVITDIIPEVTETEAAEEVTALSEITEMRDEFSKTFLMSDGTYTQVSYASPVHFEDEDGVFQEIDNRLSVNAMTGKVTTGNGGTNVAFSQSQPQVSINANGHSISWSVNKKETLQNNDNVSLMNISPSYAPFTANAVNVADTQDFKALPAEEQLMSAHKSFSEMKYASLAEGYAVNYTVAPGKVKEDILITSAENNEFVITVNATGLTASLGEYRTVIFKNNANETVLTFDVPYMYDANDEFSTDIDITLTPILGGYEITLTADEEWLNDEARVYPVVIDPDYIYGDHVNESNIVDTMVHEGDSASNCSCGLNHDTNDFVIINRYNSKKYYSYFKFMPSDAYAAGKINSASVNLHLTSTTNGSATFRLYRVTQDWDQSTLTYANKPSYNSTPIDSGVSYVATGSGSNRVVTAEFDVTQITRDFVAGTEQNYGFMLAYDNESINDYNRFHTVEYATVAWRPQLKTNYSTYIVGSGTKYINNLGSHLFMSANATTLETATYHHSAQGSISNAGLNWTITPLDNYVSYFAISWGSYHLYDTGTQVGLYYATPPEDINLSTVRTEFQWQIFEYSNDTTGKNYCVIKNRETGRLLSVSGSAIVGVNANTGEYQQWHVGYEPCTSIEIENRVAVAGEVINFEDLGIDYNGSGADPTFADDYSLCYVTISPSSVATVEDYKITLNPNFVSGTITVTFGRTDTSATAVFNVYVNNFIGEFYLTNLAANKVMCYNYNDNSNSIQALIYSNQSHECQKWLIERIGNTAYYTIKSTYNNYYIALPENTNYNAEDELYVKAYSGTIPETAHWKMYYDDLGGLRILPRNSWDVCIDISGNTSTSVLKLSECSNASSQLWRRISLRAEKTVFNSDIDVNSEYNREAAVAYAKQYAKNSNNNYTDYSNGNGDCTNFVSQCLYAGGMEFVGAPSNWFESTMPREQNYQNWFYTDFNSDNDVSYTWTSAEYFRQHWGWSPANSNMRAYGYIQYDTIDQLELDKEYLLSIVQPGDIIQHINKNNEGSAGHSMIVYAVTNDNIYYAQHSENGPDDIYVGDSLNQDKYYGETGAIRFSVFGVDEKTPENSGITERYNGETSDFAFILVNRW